MKNFFGHKRFPFALFVILVFAAGLATYHLSESPLTGYDEGILVQMARNFSERGSLSLQTDTDRFASGSYMSTAYPILAPVAAAMRLFGPTLLTARSVVVGFLLGFLALFYAVSVRAFGKRTAFFATVLMATHASLYTYGKSVMGEIPGLFYVMLFLLGLDALAKRRGRHWPLIVATAAALGLAAVTKPIFLLVLPAAAVTLFIYRKTLPVSAATVAVAAGVVGACFAIWFATQFSLTDDFDKILLFYRNPYLIQDVAGTVIANLKRFVTEATPLYMVGLLVVWVGSVVMRVLEARKTQRLIRETFSVVETFSLVFVLLVLMAYLRTPGFYRYFFLANVVILVAFPFALEDVIRRVVSRFPSWKAEHVARDLAAVLCIGLIVLQGDRLFRTSYIASTYHSSQTARLEEYFATRFDRSQKAYVYDVPEVVPFFPTRNYSQWIEVSGGGTFQVGVPLADALASDADIIIVNEKRYYQELDTFKDYHPLTQVVRYILLARNAR